MDVGISVIIMFVGISGFCICVEIMLEGISSVMVAVCINVNDVGGNLWCWLLIFL